MGDTRQAKRLFNESISALRKAGDVPALVEAVIAQGSVMSETLNPSRYYGTIADFVDNQPAPVARIERALSQMRWAASRDEPVTEPAELALELLHKMAAGLSPTDRAALRLHPWTWPLRSAGFEVLAD